MSDYTLIQSGDPDAAENVGSLAGDIDRGGITSGLGLSNYDAGAPSIDVAAGKTVHILDTATAEWTENDGDQFAEQRDKVQVAVGLDAQTVGLDAGALNELYVDPNWDTTDSPVITASTTGAPTPEAEKIGEVDTSADEVSERWGVIEEDGTLSYPDNAAANAALSSLPSGVAVIDRTNGVRMVDGKISVPTLEADVLNSADLANAASGLVPVAQGSGDLAFQSIKPTITQPNQPPVADKGELWAQPINPLQFNADDTIVGIDTSQGLVFASSQDASVYAYDISTGQQEWKFNLQSSAESAVFASDDTVFAGDFDGFLYAINISDGSEKWKFDAGATISSGIDGDGNYVFFISENGKLWALDVTDGSKHWEYSVGSYAIGSGVQSVGGSVYAGDGGNRINAVNISDGSEKWTYSTGGPVLSELVVSNDVVYAGSKDENFYAINATDGTEKWSYATGDNVQRGVAVSEEEGIAMATARSTVYAVSIADGTLQWDFTPTDFPEYLDSSDGSVYVGAGDIYSLNVSDGSTNWSYTTGTVPSRVLVSYGLMFSGDNGGTFYGVSKESGSTRSQTYTLYLSDGNEWRIQT